MISSSDFARTARETLERHSVPYSRGGKTLKGMDSAGFITYCLAQNGVRVSYSGTNDLFRNEGTRCIPLKDALASNQVVPGAILLHITHDGQEPAKYQSDGKGNCDFALIAVSSKEGIYPSQMAGKLISTSIDLKNGKANYVLFSKHVDYGASPRPSPAPSVSKSSSSVDSLDSRILTKTSLRLRRAPSLDGEVITTIPRGTEVKLIELGPEWCHVRYTISASLYHDGWCASKYLTLD